MLLIGCMQPLSAQNTITPPDYNERVGILITPFIDLGEFAEFYHGFHDIAAGQMNEVIQFYFKEDKDIGLYFRVGSDVAPYTPNITVEISISKISVNHWHDVMRSQEYYGQDGTTAQAKTIREGKNALITATIIIRDWRTCKSLYTEELTVKGDIIRAQNVLHGNPKLVPKAYHPADMTQNLGRGRVALNSNTINIRDEDAVAKALFTLSYRTYKFVISRYLAGEMHSKRLKERHN